MGRLPLLFVIIVLTVSAATAQPFRAFIFYLGDDGSPPLADSCVLGTPLPDGSVVYILWDSNENGPDAADPWPPICGVPPHEPFYCVNYNQFLLNGGQEIGEPGYFSTNNSFSSLGPFPQPWNFYLRVCTPELHWDSNVFTLGPGTQIVLPTFVCLEEPCMSCFAPIPPINFIATDGASCDGINLTWGHEQDPQSFEETHIFRNGEFLIAVPESLGTSYFDTSAMTDFVYSYGIQAVRYCLDSEDTLFSTVVSDTGYRQFTPPTALSVQASNDQLNQVTVTWTNDSNVGLEHWMIRRNLSTVGTVVAGEPGMHSFIHLDPPLGPALYDVLGVNAACLSSPSNADTGEALGTVADEDFILHPSAFRLSAYPNPFNASTTIRFDVAVPQSVQIRVFDVSGREVAVLEDRMLGTGSYQIEFSGDNLPSGLYFVQMQAGKFDLIQKLVLLK